MSGIVGVFNRNGEPVRHEILVSMCDAIKHRGPHGRGVWIDGPVGLGHVLLHTTEESLREEQPSSLDGKTWITADARIDDRDGLIDLLKSRVDHSETLKEATDVKLFLLAYHVWGVECVNHIIGVFSAAIWDDREQKLICLRDHIGIKPFYYAQTSDRLIIASEAKGILASGLIPKCIYEPRIADYLVNPLEGVDKTCTFFKGVVRLPPAHRMVVDPNKIHLEKYWQLDPSREIRLQDQRDYAEAFRELFYDSVRDRLRGVQPVASMLSGGLDSSSIVAAARDILKTDNTSFLPTFSMINSSDKDCTETYYINQVIAQRGLNPYLMKVEDTLDYKNHLLWKRKITDDLFDFGMHVPQIIYVEAHRNGVTAMLDGVDGHLGLGQPGNYLAYLLQIFSLRTAIYEAKCTRKFYYRLPGNVYTELLRAARSAYTPEILRSARHFFRKLFHGQTLKRSVEDSIINKKFAIDIKLLRRFEQLRSYGVRSQKINLRQNHANALNHPFLVVALERYDRVASQYSIEPRHPILDRRLIEFCLALPWEQKVHNGWTKMIARRSMKDLLPEDVIWRRGGEHLGPRVTAQLMSGTKVPTKDYIIENLESISDYVDTDMIKKICRAYISSEDVSDSDRWKIINAKALIEWLRWWKKE